MQSKKYIDGLFDTKERESEIRKAHGEIVEMQKNKNNILKSGLPYIDNFLPDGLKNKMVFCGSRPAMGKTYNSSIVIDNLLDKKLNPLDIEVLRLNWEMQSSSLLLRELKKSLKKGMKDIIAQPYTEDEKPIVIDTVHRLDDKRITNVSKIIEGEDLVYLLKSFCERNPTTYKIVIIDHLHILGDKKRIDAFLSICNDMKLEYPFISFIGYFQLNRTLETYWRGSNDNKPNPKNFRPHAGFIYNTDFIQQFGDLIYTLVIPQVANLDEYASVPKEYYKHLEEHFVEGNNLDNSWARLKGRNRVYIDVIKVRLVDDFEDPRLFCEIINPSIEEEVQEKYMGTKPTNFSSTPNFDKEKPVFDDPYANITANFDPKAAFDIDETEEDETKPF
jgi:hypothetical protein